jgi:hypothetical protein
VLRAWLKRNQPGKAARNERRKAAATTLNALSVAFAVTTVLQPILNGRINLPMALAAMIGVIVFQALIHHILSSIED